MIAAALESNGATVYIIGRRFDVVQKAANENNVSAVPLGIQHFTKPPIHSDTVTSFLWRVISQTAQVCCPLLRKSKRATDTSTSSSTTQGSQETSIRIPCLPPMRHMRRPTAFHLLLVVPFPGHQSLLSRHSRTPCGIQGQWTTSLTPSPPT